VRPTVQTNDDVPEQLELNLLASKQLVCLEERHDVVVQIPDPGNAVLDMRSSSAPFVASLSTEIQLIHAAAPQGRADALEHLSIVGSIVGSHRKSRKALRQKGGPKAAFLP
jgi:hypothetical protein